MRWLVAGAHGMLGQDLVKRIQQDEHEVIAVDRDEIDITDVASVEHAVSDVDVVVNVAAFTAVDAAEEQEAAAFRVNAVGPQILARRAKEIGARLVHISTDYVFGGSSDNPYREYEVMQPLGAYGRTKAAGEWAVRAHTDDYLIVRTAWLYGVHGNSFPATMRKLTETHESISVVTDEFGQPTWTVDLADLIVRLIDAEAPSGIYHGTSSGSTNWNAFAQEIMQSLGKPASTITETTAAAFKRAAPRPHYSVLGHSELDRIGVQPIGDWKARWEAAAPVMFAK